MCWTPIVKLYCIINHIQSVFSSHDIGTIENNDMAIKHGALALQKVTTSNIIFDGFSDKGHRPFDENVMLTVLIVKVIQVI